MKNKKLTPLTSHGSGKTPLIQTIKKAFRIALLSSQSKGIPADEMLGIQEEAYNTRRKFLKESAIGIIGLTAGGALLDACKKGDRLGAKMRKGEEETSHSKNGGKGKDPKIVIVGAGIAGLNCAYTLKQNGVSADIYEASARTGGRILTGKNLMAAGLTTELGGEFIDSGHKDMLKLVKHFGLNLLDVQSAGNAGLIDQSYYFDGQSYTETDVINAFVPIAATMQADIDLLPDSITYTNPGNAVLFDNISLEQYIDNLACASWLKKLLKVAFVTEYGLDAGQQSCINMLYLISTDTSSGKFSVFGESDERYKVVGGNQQITNELTKQLTGKITYEYKLEAVKQTSTGKYVLTFQNQNNVAVDVTADMVVFAIPFTILRTVNFNFTLPSWKRNAIDNLGYGTNAKLMIGFDNRQWRTLGSRGSAFTDLSFQIGWDNSELQSGTAGGYTMYSGGTPGVNIGSGSALSQATSLMPGLELVYPGVTSHLNGKVERFHWPSYPLTKCSYACYKPGQFSTIAGAEIKPVDNMFFAGEHCSLDYQGYMNGGAETGRKTANKILDRI